MDYLTIIMLIFSVAGAVDRILGNRLGLGKEFEKAFMLLGPMTLSMIGMIIIAPLIAQIASPVSRIFSNVLHMDPSIIPASVLANDMGGASLSVAMAQNEALGRFNALVVSSMMGCTISFTIPFALGIVSKNQHRELVLGLLCGIVTIPIGCLVSGLICKLPLGVLLLNLVPIIVFAGLICVGLICFPAICINIFKAVGNLITALITAGLGLGIIQFLTGAELIAGLGTIAQGADICINAAIVLSGAFPLMHVLSKLLTKPLSKVSSKIGVNVTSLVGIISSLASNATAFGMMDKMNPKGIVMNAAFSVSGAFVLGGHLAFTMAFDGAYTWPMIAGKLISGASAIVVSIIIYQKVDANLSSV